MTVYIPNINTIGTLIDRLTVENVKLSFFLEQSKTPNLDIDRENLQERIEKQEIVKNEVERMLRETLEHVFSKKEYNPLFEERTFS
jgi:hypothetical protein